MWHHEVSAEDSPVMTFSDQEFSECPQVVTEDTQVDHVAFHMERLGIEPQTNGNVIPDNITRSCYCAHIWVVTHNIKEFHIFIKLI